MFTEKGARDVTISYTGITAWIHQLVNKLHRFNKLSGVGQNLYRIERHVLNQLNDSAVMYLLEKLLLASC